MMLSIVTFSIMDEDGDGKISKEELRMFLQKFGRRNFAHDEFVEEVFHEVDANQDNSISMDELKNVFEENPSFKKALAFRE
jgi:Ca2+-binding EF-hand superfamily protein